MSIYGTAFEQLSDEERDAIKRKPKSIQEEIATDEKGRRRFHGAFTGGFSAGYFNSVGSKHGWVPQTFKSTRNERAEKGSFRAEDFMDEEDFGEFGIASKRICTKSDFLESLNSGNEKSQLAWERSIFPQSATNSSLSSNITSSLIEILKPVNDSIGIRILRKMGWKAGKGAGPTMSRRALEKQKVIDAKSRGENYKFDESIVCEIESIAPNAEFSANDIQEIQFNTKENVHGLGYVPLQEMGVLEQNYGSIAAGLKLTRKGKAIRGQAFGVGAFEEDDEDIYTSYDLSQYDFEVGASTSTANKESERFDLTFLPAKKTIGSSRKFFEAPKLPHGYRPVLILAPINVSNVSDKILKAKESLTPFERARFFGDRSNSVMELLNEKDRKYLKQVQDKKSQRVENTKQNTKDISERFEEEPLKKHRFNQYILYLKRGIDFPQPAGLTRLEWDKELVEFKEALTPELRALLHEVNTRQEPLAKVQYVQPIAEQLKSRFQTESGIQDNKQNFSKDHDRIQAVRMNMFGEITRIMYQWYPSNELCKRFNVQNPFPDSSLVGVPELQKRTAKTFSDSMDITILGSSGALGLPNTANELNTRKEIKELENNKGLKNNKENEDFDFLTWNEKEPQNEKEKLKNSNEEVNAADNAPFELLKALFEESSTDDDNDSESEEKLEIINVNKELENQKLSPEIDEKKDGIIVEKIITVFDLVDDDDVYGPKLPPSPIIQNDETKRTNISTEKINQLTIKSNYNDNFELNSKRKKLSKEKKHKKESKKKKSKDSKKHKKRKKRSKSTNSSSDSDIHVIN